MVSGIERTLNASPSPVNNMSIASYVSYTSLSEARDSSSNLLLDRLGRTSSHDEQAHARPAHRVVVTHDCGGLARKGCELGREGW